jgi:hypothetical protein
MIMNECDNGGGSMIKGTCCLLNLLAVENVEKGRNLIFVGWDYKLSLLCAPCLVAMKGGHVCMVVKLCFAK